MIWSDKGYLLSKNKFGENSLITEFYTKNQGKVSGIIYGATSKKIRNYLQIGNKIHVNFNSKNNNKLGYFNTEIISPENIVFSDAVKMVKIPSYEGDMSILKNHISIITF